MNRLPTLKDIRKMFGLTVLAIMVVITVAQLSSIIASSLPF